MPDLPEGLLSRDSLMVALHSIRESDKDDVVKKTFGIFVSNNAPKGTSITQTGAIISETRYRVCTPASCATFRIRLIWIESEAFNITDDDARVWFQVWHRATIMNPK